MMVSTIGLRSNRSPPRRAGTFLVAPVRTRRTARRERTSNPYPRAPRPERSPPELARTARTRTAGRTHTRDRRSPLARPRLCRRRAWRSPWRRPTACGARSPRVTRNISFFGYAWRNAGRPVGNVSNPFRIRTLVRIGAVRSGGRVGRKTEARDSFGTKLPTYHMRLTPVSAQSRVGHVRRRSPTRAPARKRWAKTENDINLQERLVS
jgi:hypothetical protein